LSVTAQAAATSYNDTEYWDGTTEASATSNAAFIEFTNSVLMYSGGLKVRRSSAWITGAVKVRRSSVWVAPTAVKVRRSGAWTTVT
jgi:hypothetical protein